MSQKRLCFLATICVALTLSTVSVAEGQGRRAPPASQTIAASSLPELEVAVVVLAPGYSLTDQKSMENMEKQNAYPKVRHAETIYFSSKIKDAIKGLPQISDAFVAPSSDVYADLYFTGRIRMSTGEELEIVWNLKDATGKYHLSKKVSKLRLFDGWDRFFGEGMDPFDKVYTSIASEISKTLGRHEKNHEKRLKENEKLRKSNEELIAKGRKPRKLKKPSDLQHLTDLRDLMVAGYFDGDNYYDHVEGPVGRGKTYRVKYLPDKQERSWQRIEQVNAAYQGFVRQLSQSYDKYAQQIGEVHGEYIRTMYPYARDFREAQQKLATAQFVAFLGGMIITLELIKEGKVDMSGATPELVAAVAAVSAVYVAIKEDKKLDRTRALIEEVATGFETQFAPLTLALGEEQRVLEGRPKEQLESFIQILAGEAQKRDQDIPEITVIAGT